MKLPVVASPAAKKDIVELRAYFSEISLELNYRFRRMLKLTYEDLSRMPTLGSLRFFRSPEMQNVRTWSVKNFRNYILFYRIEEKRVIILRVLHAAMNYEETFNKEDETE